MSAYKQALAAGNKKGVSMASAPELMAMILDSTLQILCGAVSPELVWDGAQARDMTTPEVLALANARDMVAIDDLMFEPPSTPIRKGVKR